MPTPNERRALIFLAALGALGVGIRAFRRAPSESTSTRDSAESRGALGRQISSVDSAAVAKRSAGGRGRTRRAGSKSDSSRGTGPGAASRGSAMHERAANGVQAVAPDPLALYEQRRIEVMRRNQDAQARIERDLGGQRPASASPPVTRQAPQGSRDGIATPRLAVDLDTAGAEAIASLPWVGPALAARIVADRAARGPFGSLAALERVRGVGPGLTAKIAQFVVFSRSGSPGESVVKFRAVRVRPKRP